MYLYFSIEKYSIGYYCKFDKWFLLALEVGENASSACREKKKEAFIGGRRLPRIRYLDDKSITTPFAMLEQTVALDETAIM